MSAARPLQRWRALGIALVLVLLLTTLLYGPSQSAREDNGSTYSRAPSGYSAWYEYLETREIPIQRWQQPLHRLPETATTPATLIRVFPNDNRVDPEFATFELQEWLETGNRLIVLGARAPVTPAPFERDLTSDYGPVAIATRRRAEKFGGLALLSDTEGAAIWRRAVGEGEIIFSVTPDLAANAYQDREGNFALLAALASPDGQTVYIDETLHGHLDRDPVPGAADDEGIRGPFDYLSRTPLLPATLQLAILVALAVLAANRRFGPLRPLPVAPSENSLAYIRALAGVLRGADSHAFVMETVGQREQQQLQRALGLGSASLPPDVVASAWAQRTGQPAQKILELLQTEPPQHPTAADLQDWLARWQACRVDPNSAQSQQRSPSRDRHPE